MRDARLVAVADIDPFKARRLAEPHGAQWFASLDEMLAKAKPDVVHILLTPELHARFALQCMEAGTHVLVEKPLCLSAAECAELEIAAARCGTVVGVNHNVAAQEPFPQLIALIRQRRLGAIQHVSVSWSVPWGMTTFDAPLYQRHGPGAVILETGPHPLSLVVRLLGEAHSASTLVVSNKQNRPDTWLLSLGCERGTAQCLIGIGREFTDTRVHVIGEDGSAIADLRLGYLAVTENTRFSPRFFKVGDSLEVARSVAASAARRFLGYAGRVWQRGLTSDPAITMRASLGDFYDAIREHRRPNASVEEGLAVVRTCLRAIEAGRAVIPTREEETCQAAM